MEDREKTAWLICVLSIITATGTTILWWRTLNKPNADYSAFSKSVKSVKPSKEIFYDDNGKIVSAPTASRIGSDKDEEVPEPAPAATRFGSDKG